MFNAGKLNLNFTIELNGNIQVKIQFLADQESDMPSPSELQEFINNLSINEILNNNPDFNILHQDVKNALTSAEVAHESISTLIYHKQRIRIFEFLIEMKLQN